MYGCVAILLAKTAAMVAKALTPPSRLKVRTLKALNTSGYSTKCKSKIGTGKTSVKRLVVLALDGLEILWDTFTGLTKFSYSAAAAAAAAAAAGPVKGTRSSMVAICVHITHANVKAATRDGKKANPQQSMAIASSISMDMAQGQAMHTHKDLTDRKIRRPTGLPMNRVTRGKFMLCSCKAVLHHESLGRHHPSTGVPVRVASIRLEVRM